MTKAELARRAQEILRLPVGTVLAGDDLAIATALLAMHPTGSEKAGPGVRHWVVRENVYGRGHELHIIRTDGSEIDFSYRRALQPRTPAAERADLLAALRLEVAEQIVTYRRERLAEGTTCAISGVRLDNDSAHVDHVPPRTFAVLADAWLIRHPSPRLEPAGNRGRQLTDRNLAAEWQLFHLWAARLRLVHQRINAVIATVRKQAAA